jgi:membrane protein YqaA with SNARE-associated domain
MITAMLLGGTVAFAFCAAIVPLGPVEVYLAVAVSANHLGWPAAIAVAAIAALGQVSGKFVVFQCARRSTRSASRFATRVRNVRVVRRLQECDMRHPSRLIALVAASSITSVPPFAIVVPMAGAGGIRKRTFFTVSAAGRLIRFMLIVVAIAS